MKILPNEYRGLKLKNNFIEVTNGSIALYYENKLSVTVCFTYLGNGFEFG